MEKELINYIKESREKGFSDEEIKKALLDAGWEEKDIEEGLETPPAEPAELTLAVSKLPSPIALLKDAWGIYKSRFWVFIGIIALLIIFVAALCFLVLFGGLLVVITGIPILFLVAGFVFSTFVLYIPFLWTLISLIYVIKEERKIRIFQAYKRGLSKLASAWWIYFLGAIIVRVGWGFFFLPGIIFGIWFSLAFFILTVEDLKGVKVLAKSKEYVKGQWDAVFVRFLFIGLIFLAFLAIMGSIFWMVNIGWLENTILIISFIGCAIFTPLAVVYGFLIYKNLKLLKGDVVISEDSRKFVRLALVIIITILVLAILGILLTMGLIMINKAKEVKERAEEAQEQEEVREQEHQQITARDNQRIEDLEKIANALELYYRDHGSYPIMEMCIEVHSDGFPTYLEDGSIKWDSLESILQAGGYIGSLPEDPKKDPTSSDYVYIYNSDDGASYTLSALLESWHDALNSDFDGRMGGCSFCDDPTYCIQSQK